MKAMMIGNGKAVHAAYEVDGRLCGSLCDPFVYTKRSRMVYVEAEPTCPRCAKAVQRAAQQKES